MQIVEDSHPAENEIDVPESSSRIAFKNRTRMRPNKKVVKFEEKVNDKKAKDMQTIKENDSDEEGSVRSIPQSFRLNNKQKESYRNQ